MERQLTTSLIGPMNVTRAVLPIMRKQRSGHVVTISSSAGFAGFEYGTAYAASKFGVDGWMESLAPEVEPFGIHATVVNPGFFRTELLTKESTNYAPASIEDYAERNAAQREFWDGMNGKQGGDPAKLARALATIVDLDHPPFRFIAGADALAQAEEKLAERREQIDAHRDLSTSLALDDAEAAHEHGIERRARAIARRGAPTGHMSGDLVGPGGDSVPVACVARRHAVEREAQARRVDHAAEDRDRHRNDVGHTAERALELGQRAAHRALVRRRRADREDGHRHRGEDPAVATQEAPRVAVPASGVERPPSTAASNVRRSTRWRAGCTTVRNPVASSRSEIASATSRVEPFFVAYAIRTRGVIALAPPRRGAARLPGCRATRRSAGRAVG